ncbi:MAG: glycyl-radical enzyme activating protein [Prevotellaceae bacterium]|jgi:pyruvate formate lyase activating enzyme|nr:glycyl-radical enzyme activating protein [Prevotellaceae bacterium]
MTGIIFDIKRFAVHDGPGIRTTIFFKGCSLKCSWCHNPESIGLTPLQICKTVKLNSREFVKEEIVGYEISDEQLFNELKKEQVFMNESGGGVSFSGGEPLIQYNFLLKMLEICKIHGIHTAVDTSLFSSWKIIDEINRLSDLFLIDLKLMDDAKHQQYTGVSNKPILENIIKLSDAGANIRIRIPIIPNVNDTQDNITQSISFIKNLPKPVNGIDLLPFHNTANEKYKRVKMDNLFGHIRSLKKEELEGLKNRFENVGFTVKIGG